MSCVTDELVNITGLCDLTTFNLTAPNNVWTEISVPETLIVPHQKPDMEQLNSVNVFAKIIRHKVVVTPTSPTGVTNFEGKTLTGRKLIVEGEICQTISYTANVPEQSVHSAHFTVPFSAFIVIPLFIINASGVQVDTLDVNFQVNVCIEDVYIKQITLREIFKNVTLLLQAIPGPLGQCPDEC